MDTKDTLIEGGVPWVCVGQPVKLDSDGLFIGPQTFLLFLIMTQTKTGAFPSMGRIPQLFGHTVLAASMLAGGVSLLNAGGAMAVACTGAWAVTPVDYFHISGPTPPGSGSCNSFAPPFEVDVAYQFNPIAPPLSSGTIVYSLVASPGFWFTAVELDSTHQGQGVTVQKQVFANLDQFNNPVNPISGILTSYDGQPDGPTLISGSPTQVYVKDTFSIGENGGLVSINNEIRQTPGPLPILGAGAAFGFSRKLRGRIKAARLG